MRRFPPETPKPQEVIDLEKPDEEDVTLKWNEMMDKSNAATNMEKATAQLQEWKEKLDKFNSKVPQPTAETPVEIIQEDNSVPHIDLKGQKKTKQEEIAVDKELQEMKFERYERENEKKIAEVVKKAKADDGFDLDEHAYDMEPIKDNDEVLDKIIEQHEEDIRESGKEYDELDIEGFRPGKVVKPKATISEQIEEAMEPERTRPDFTEVIEPEQAVQEMMEDPKKAMEEDVKIVGETARKTHLADMDAYVQNEEQTDNTAWKKIKTKQTSEDQYHEMQEKRIDTLMTKLDAGELLMEDLTPEDRQVIIDIRMQNESGDKIK
jgi:hypothetical protein